MTTIKRPSVLEIWLNKTRVGTLTNLPYDRNLFVFDNSYVDSSNRPTLSLSFTDLLGNLVNEPQEVTSKVPPFFSNLLPEGRLREYLAEKGGVNHAREFFLLWLLGADLPGAVVVNDADGDALPPEASARSGKIAQKRKGVLRFSLAGVQLKFSAVGQPGKQLAIPVEGRGGYWIIKLPSPSYPLLPENEFSMMKLAAEVGIDVAESGLVPTGEIENLPPEVAGDRSNSLYVKRFDRTQQGGRIHIEDFNQVYGQFPAAKYKNYSYGNMAKDIWQILGESDLKEFIRRLIFNAAIGNSDMHLKNWSLIYSDGRTPHLAPGYDFVSTIRYIDDKKMALSMAREKDTKFLDMELLQRFARRSGIPAHLVVTTASETAEKFITVWRTRAKELPLDPQMRERIEDHLKYVPLMRRFVTNDTHRDKARARARKSQ